MAEKGSLIVFVTTARSAIPIKNAFVSVFEPNSKKLLGFRRSNSEGLTSTFEFETPDMSLSLTPQNGDIPYQAPFRVIDVQIDHPMYRSVLIQDVQVFSGRESIQNVDLIPLAEYATPGEQTQTFPVSPQNL